MKKAELEEKIVKIIDPDNHDKRLRDLTIDIGNCTIKDWKSPNEKVGIKITLKRMYEFYDFTFKEFDEFAKLFKTEQINLKNGDWSPGCNSCDHGSSYETILEIFDSPITIE